ncbi:MAG TPA: hypothetical protein PKC18_18500 [Lacipirellulaceae bacterium]|nr:hypothetical protein [Lacipirellulaceae bacterium]HMP06188.1 hypothetical protein [Lacipirellulaceae bacterium]
MKLLVRWSIALLAAAPIAAYTGDECSLPRAPHAAVRRLGPIAHGPNRDAAVGEPDPQYAADR